MTICHIKTLLYYTLIFFVLQLFFIKNVKKMSKKTYYMIFFQMFLTFLWILKIELALQGEKNKVLYIAKLNFIM